MGVRHDRRTGRVTLDFGDLRLDVGAAAEAALALADVTATVWFDHVMRGMEESGGSGIIPR